MEYIAVSNKSHVIVYMMIAGGVHSYLHAVVLVHKLFFALLDHISSVLGVWQ